MDLRNKTFRNNRTGEVIRVIDSFENIAILENKEKVDVRRLTNTDFFTEQVDPNNFFSNQNQYNILAEKIKSIPLNQIRDESDNSPVQVNPLYNDSVAAPSFNESAIIMSTEDDERAELARKYGINSNPVESIQRQNEAFAKILGDDIGGEDLPVVQTQVKSQPDIQRIEVQREPINEPISQPIMAVEDPIITMFKKTKRNVEFSISFDVSDKIPRRDFIEMMEDSYEISIIDFLSDEFTNKILKDPSIIKNRIKEKIKEVVYGKEKSSTEVETITQTKPARTKRVKTQKKDTE